MYLNHLTLHTDTEQTDECEVNIVNIERDDESQITLYAEEQNQKVHYFVISQDILDELKKL